MLHWHSMGHFLRVLLNIAGIMHRLNRSHLNSICQGRAADWKEKGEKGHKVSSASQFVASECN